MNRGIMKRSYTIILLCSLIVTAFGICQAELYKYTDKSGAVCFTDDLSKIPEDQREQVKQMYEIKSAPVDQSGKKEQVPGTGEAAGSENLDSEEKIKKDFNELENFRKRLEELYSWLENELKEIRKISPSGLPENELNAYNERVKVFNQKNKEYQKEKEIFDKQVDIYNSRVKKDG